ncbi:MAG TPA: type II toxin-antitoxin system RelE/ParE family toxin [Thermoanaerobaculia bacterium]|nr:type II toxin-antitoxin system RelE/ParE family toxin [Thermoanaerobaculia bacterium]
MTVKWTKRAIRHLERIAEYVAKDSPANAQRLIDRITARSTQIGEFPFSGRRLPESDLPSYLREVIEPPYRIIYRVRQTRIDVIAVIHSSRLLPRLR